MIRKAVCQLYIVLYEVILQTNTGLMPLPLWTIFIIFFGVTVQTLKIMYTTLNSPPQLTGWKIIGGDPCRESWEGIGCEGSSVVSMYETRLFTCNLISQMQPY